MSGQRPKGAQDGTLSERLAARLAQPAADADRRRAALHLLDWSACALAGSRGAAAAAMRRAGVEEAVYWGALGNVLEMDDVDKRALLHPGPVVIPAALCAAEEVGASAAAFLDAVIRGYEAMIRVGRAVGPEHYRYWHNTGSCGPFGAAAAAASVFGLDTNKTAEAIGLAGTQASGFWQVRHEPKSHAKQLHTARAVHAGLLSAELARAGFIGLRSIFEGPQGFFAATCGGADPNAVVAGDRAGWAIHDVSFKPWPACRHAHATIDAGRMLKSEGVTAADIEAGVIEAYRDAVVFCDKPTPRDPLSAKFSLQHGLAAAFLSESPSLDDFEGAGLSRSDFAALRAKFRVEESALLTARYPARFGAAVELRLKNGSRRRAEVADALGDPENPLTEEQIRQKAMMLLGAAGLSDGDARGLIGAALALADAGALDAYLGALRRGLA
jgi:2-methylcitrate dehydratase PrpD